MNKIKNILAISIAILPINIILIWYRLTQTENFSTTDSLRFKDLIKKTIEDFGILGIEAKFPNLESDPVKDKLTIELMSRIEKEHFKSISESEALYS